MAIVHELSWSSSRSGTFESCQRRYYYDYYGSWTGWDSRAADDRRKAYILKKMTRMPMLAGDVLHRALAEWFGDRSRGKTGTEMDVLERSVRLLREGYKESRDGLWRQRPARLVHLAEHHYSEERIDEATGAAGEYGKRYIERLKLGAKHFFSMPELAIVRAADPASYLACEEMGTFDLFDSKIYAIPDFAFRDGDGRVRIYDWKTGSPRERDLFQLAIYVLYARAMWDVAPEDVLCLDVYLPTGEVRELKLDAAEEERTLERVRTTLEAMRAVHFDADRSAGDPERFPMVDLDGPSGRECGMCNYRELCGRMG